MKNRKSATLSILALCGSMALCGCRTIPVEPGVTRRTVEQAGQILTEYSRDGIRNLRIVQHPNPDPDKAITHQVVFYKGRRVLVISEVQGRRSFLVESHIPVSVGTTLDEKGQTAEVMLTDPHHVLVESFTVEDALLVPLPNDELARLRQLTIDLNHLFDPRNFQRQTPDEFTEQALGIASKYKKK